MGANPNTSNEAIRYFKLVAKAEKADPEGKKAIVEIVKRGEEYVHGDWFGSLSGFIVHGEVRDFEWEGKVNKKCVLKIYDGSDTMQLEFMLSFAAYGLINAMLCTDFSHEVEIAAWISKGYVGAGIRYVGDAQNIPWGIKSEDQPKAVEYTTPGGVAAKDYTNIEKFWLEKFMLVAAKFVRSNFNLAAAKPVAQIGHDATREVVAEAMAHPEIPEEEMYHPQNNPQGWFRLDTGELIDDTDSRHPNSLPF